MSRNPGILALALWLGVVPAPFVCPAPVGASDAVDRLAASLRLPSVSRQDGQNFDAEAFLAFHRFLEESFPRVHASLRRHVIGRYSLLFEWAGREVGRAPILLAAHIDVVPVLAERRQEWTHPPFAGVVEDGFVWGRGTLDDKVGVMAVLEAVEKALGEGFRPLQTVYLAFGHDEELGGEAGAGAITAWLEDRGARLRFTLDEGLAVTEGAVPGVDRPVALIGIAEKGYLTLRLTAHAEGGHSSTPPRTSAIGRLGRALQRLEDHPMPARMGGVVRATLDATAPHMPLLSRTALLNLWLFGSLVENQLSAQPAGNAMIRTTTAVTMVEGGVKENVLPATATATVNFRILPGDTPEDVVDHVRRAIDDPEVTIEPGRATQPSEVSDVASPAYALLRDTILEWDSDLIVAPGLVVGGTDTKHYGRLAQNSFRFMPLRLRPSDLTRIHGVDERLSVDNYLEAIDFYGRLLRNAEALP